MSLEGAYLAHLGKRGLQRLSFMPFLSIPDPSSCRELTKRGCHNFVAPSSPTVTARSSDPGCPAEKTGKPTQKEWSGPDAKTCNRAVASKHWALGLFSSTEKEEEKETKTVATKGKG